MKTQTKVTRKEAEQFVTLAQQITIISVIVSLISILIINISVHGIPNI